MSKKKTTKTLSLSDETQARIAASAASAIAEAHEPSDAEREAALAQAATTMARTIGMPSDILDAIQLVGVNTLAELEKIGGDPATLVALSGKKYRLVNPYHFNDYQAEMLREMIQKAIAALPSDDTPQPEPAGDENAPKRPSFSVEAFLDLLIGNTVVHRFFAVLYMPESETVFNPATVDERIEDMRSLTYGQKVGALYRFFTSGIGWAMGSFRGFFLPLLRKATLEMGVLGSVLQPSESA